MFAGSGMVSSSKLKGGVANYPFVKQAMPFLTVDAILCNQAILFGWLSINCYD